MFEKYHSRVVIQRHHRQQERMLYVSVFLSKHDRHQCSQ